MVKHSLPSTTYHLPPTTYVLFSASLCLCGELSGLVLLACVLSCDAAETVPLAARLDAALARSAQFMVSKQKPDGTWRSETYGALKHSADLTPLVMSCLFFLPQGGEPAKSAFLKGEEFLLGTVTPEGTLNARAEEFVYPVYTGASVCRMAALREKDEPHLRAQRAWLKAVLARRLSRELGWTPGDPQFGGWGFSLDPPRKPAPGEGAQTFCESNLSATLFGLAALRSAKVPATDSAYAEILIFVRRCQNFSGDPALADPACDDGGFFFIPNDELQNKAGAAGRDRHGKVRFHSYGTMTADGLRALMRRGLSAEEPCVAAARRWLERNFDAAHNPGVFAKEREELRDSTYYYWTWAVAHAFQSLRVRTIETRGEGASGRTDWSVALAEELLRRQRHDGAWSNRFTDAKEDDPLIATPWAASALAICRAVLTGDDLTLFPRPAP